MKMKLLAVILMAVTLILSNGCVRTLETGTGAGNVVYSSGTLKFREYTTFDVGWKAAQAAVKDLKFAVMSQKRDAVLGNIIARAPGDRKVSVDVNKVSGTVVEFQIRVGTTGDESLSKEIRDAIRKQL
jgi:hypothetical protein